MTKVSWWWGGIGAVVLCCAAVVTTGCSPRVVTRVRDYWDEVATRIDRLDEEGMTELLEEKKAELDRAIRQVQTVLDAIEHHDPTLAAQIRSELRELVSDQEAMIAAREGDLLEKRRAVLAALKRSHRKEEEVAHRASLVRLSERTALQARVLESQTRVTQGTTKQVVSEFLTGIARDDWTGVRRLFTPDAQLELTDRRLTKLKDAVPSDPQVTITRLSPEVCVAILAGRDGRQATVRMLTRNGTLSIDDVILPLSL